MPELTTQERINQLKAALATAEQTAIQELRDRRTNIVRELAAVDVEFANLTGKSIYAKEPRATASVGRNIPLSQLKEELEAAPNKTLNIRKANLELRNVRNLARVNPGLLRIGGVGAWPTVTLLK